MTSPFSARPRTLLIFNYDEWDGFFDHVAPAPAPIPAANRAAGNQDGLRGFRVPCLVAGPWARRRSVAHGLYDHTSVLRLVEWRWGLEALTVRDATARNLAETLDFEHPQLTAPRFPVPPGPFGGPCGTSAPVSTDWTALADLARSYGWPV